MTESFDHKLAHLRDKLRVAQQCHKEALQVAELWHSIIIMDEAELASYLRNPHVRQLVLEDTPNVH